MFADITEVIADLSSTTPVTAKLYVTAALTEVQILETDALQFLKLLQFTEFVSFLIKSWYRKDYNKTNNAALV